jgi:IS4 transposase
VTSKLDNSVKVKVVRHRKHFLQCNRMSWNMGKIRSDYAKRWQIEEAFHIIEDLPKSQRLSAAHSGSPSHLRTALLYPKGRLRAVAFACLELFPDLSPYAARNASILGELDPENIIRQELLAA